MSAGGRDALLTGAQHTQNTEGWRLTLVPCNLASAAAVATITGVIKIRNVVGRCTTAVGTTTSIQLSMGGTAMTASSDVVSLATTAILVRESGTATVLTELTEPVSSLLAAPTELLVGGSSAGTVFSVLKNASGTGVIAFSIEWTPLTAGAGIVADQA